MQQSPIIELKNFNICTASTARVSLKVLQSDRLRSEDRTHLKNSIRKKFNNSLEVVDGTLASVSSDKFSETLTAVVRVIKQSIPYVEGQTKGFTAFASNMFMDTEKGIWSLKTTKAGKLLVQTSSIEDDSALADLLSSYSSVSSTMSISESRSFASMSSSIPDVAGGDLVYYVNLDNEAKVGYVVANVKSEDDDSERVMVLAHDNEEQEIVSTVSVLAKLDASDAPTIDVQKETMHNALASNSGNVSLSDMLDYYKLVFRRSPEYYSAFESRLKNHVFA